MRLSQEQRAEPAQQEAQLPGRVSIRGDAGFPVNRGLLCVKGFHAAATLDHPERLRTPLVRGSDGRLGPASWEEALSAVVRGIERVQARHGRDAVGVYGSGALTNEKAYLLGKLARVALRTRSIDYNGRFCMSSAAAAANLALGVDRGLPFPLDDIPLAETLVLVGANPAETMPPFVRYLDEQRAAGGKLIVIDPRRTRTAQLAALHLRPLPGTDGALARGLLHLLIRDGAIDRAYVAERTEGFEEARAEAAAYWPERVERITAVPQARLFEAARLLGAARTSMILTARGPEQQVQGVRNVLAFLQVALALGQVGRRGGGFGTLTGQGNGQGGREHGQKADQLPGYRRIDDPAARRHLSSVWCIDERDLPGPGPSAAEMFASLGEPGGVRTLLVFGANPALSAPDAAGLGTRLGKLDLLVVSDFFLSETAALADVVLPSAQWAEEDGTVTNLEGRVLRRRRVLEPPPGVKTDVQILCALGERLDSAGRFAFAGEREVFEELRRASAGGIADYAGIEWDELEARGGIFWPCPDAGHAGTPRLFEERFPTPSGRARFAALRPGAPAEVPDAGFPLYLTTGRVLEHYQTGTQTRRVPGLLRLVPRASARVGVATARRHGLAEGAEVTLTSRRGSARFLVEVSSEVAEGTVFVPIHFGGDGAVNRLTHAALDPVSRMPEFKICAVRAEPGP
jgi:assimilatory nitrate reductase catalytic subunit